MNTVKTILALTLALAGVLLSTTGFAKDIGWLDTGAPGDHVRGVPITPTPDEILSLCQSYLTAAKSDEGLRKIAQTQPYPKAIEDQIRWIISHMGPDGDPVKGAFFDVQHDDHRAVLYSYVRAVLAGETLWNSETTDLTSEESFVAILHSLSRDEQVTGYMGDVFNEGFPENRNEGDYLIHAMVWGLRVNAEAPWAFQRVKTLGQQTPLLLFYYMMGVLAKDYMAHLDVPLETARQQVMVDGHKRVFGLITPEGKAPESGWPTVFLFHDIGDSAVPEQDPVYTRIREYAEQAGFQVVLAVGSPQRRASMATTAQGSLGWISYTDNVAYIKEVKKWLAAKKQTDLQRVFAIGHGNGGFFLNTVLLLEPGLFKAAVTHGAGLPFSAEFERPRDRRLMPVMIRMGERDFTQGAEEMVDWLKRNGYKDGDYEYVLLPGRGPELSPAEDYPEIFNYFGQRL